MKPTRNEKVGRGATDEEPVNWHLTLEELVAGTEGQVISRVAEGFRGVGTDTRTDLSGKVFIALRGGTFDAHDFLGQAVAAGASALVVHRVSEDFIAAMSGHLTIVKVADTLTALQDLAHFWRRKMPAKILGVTGTNGKTTTKEFTAAILGRRFAVQSSKGSFNNHWGVPLSLLSIDSAHQFAVIEMGMNHPGELTELSRIAEPDVVLVTMVGRGHLEGVGSIEGVARAKAEIYEAAPEGAVRIFNLENDQTRNMFETWGRALSPASVLTFASSSARGLVKDHAIDVCFEVVSATSDALTVAGEIRGFKGEVTVPVFGRHNLTNLMAAAAFALSCGMSPPDIWQALPSCRMAWGRNQWVRLLSGARALFDAYNANPESMKAAIENFAALTPSGSGRKFAVLGEMKELGGQAAALHRELGESVARAGFDAVVFVGASHADFSAGLRAAGFSKKIMISNIYDLSLAPPILAMLKPEDILLIKGSRGMQLEKVLADLRPLDFELKKS